MTKPLLHLTTIAAAPFRINWLHCHTPLLLPFPHRFRSLFPASKFFRPFSQFSERRFSSCLVMDSSGVSSFSKVPVGSDIASEEELTTQSKLLQEFIEISTIDKAWTFASPSGNGSQIMFSISQPNLMANAKRRSILSSHVMKQKSDSVTFHWAPFPVELNGVSSIIPSPSGSKLLVVRNSENDSPTRFEVWGPSQVEKEFQIPRTIHGSVYCDGWFEGISWNSDETLIAYVAEEPVPSKPTFTRCGFKGDTTDKDTGNWKGQGEWEEDWGESYAGKRQSALFVININSGEVQAVKGIGKSLSVGQVVWAPLAENSDQYLVFVGWLSDTRKLGIKYCYNRPCGLYAVKAPFSKSEAIDSSYTCDNASEGVPVVALTESTGSAFFPRFSPGGKFLVFFSAKTAVESGAHWTTNSLHRIDWPADGKPCQSPKVVEVVPVVMCPEDGCFPGLYCSSILSKPWLSDGSTIIISSNWRSTEAILSVNILSGDVSRISPSDSDFVWNLLALDGDNIVAVSSSPVDIPRIKYGVREASKDATWSWLDVSSPGPRCSDKIKSLLSARQFTIMQIPVKDVSENRTKGANKPYEAIFVSSKSQKNNEPDPLIVVIHGGPHSVSQSSFSKSLAFLFSLGYSLLIVNYRGSLGFGEEALQSLPGNIGSQDVKDVLAAIDHVIDKGLADPSKLAVVGGSHGGFLTTHLIGQAPDKFAAAAARNPVCNLALMVGTSDIPDWCYAESFGSKGKSLYSEVASPEHLSVFYDKSPISHISKVKTPIIFLLGAKDLRVPVSNGIQYARALKEKGNVVKIIVFPEDIHPIDRPQSDFESFLNIGVWFKKYCH